MIPNGQRPGVIHGLTIEEVLRAKICSNQAYYRIMISDHKTGYIQCATIFVYHDTYDALSNYIKCILSKLPKYGSGIHHLSNTAKVFQTYKGDSLSTSCVTPLFRKALMELGIRFNGTVTDIRKATVTLTAKYCPHLHDLMALFLGHSRKVHEKFYRINMGHPGLLEAFETLEKIQSLDIVTDCSEASLTCLSDNSENNGMIPSAINDCTTTCSQNQESLMYSSDDEPCLF